MNSQIPKASSAMYGKSRSKPLWDRFFVLLCCLVGVSNALYVGKTVTAFQVPDDRIKVDGSPDTLWKAIATLDGESVISFKDYSRIIILGDHNGDPSKSLPTPATDSIFMLVAFDSKALYFYFQAKVPTVANSKTLCTTADNQWKADAAEVYVDPTPWSQDTAVYRSYFSADAGGLIYGTSPKTIQLDKPLYDKETRVPYFRNRVTGDKFQIPAALPTGVQAASLGYRKDPSRVSVEMRIPYWGGSAAAFAPGRSLFISWGFNMYPDSLWGKSCATTDPIAYRWAKNHLNYNEASTKPPGWRLNDSTHYDPSRSWDGWGRLTLGNGMVDTRQCKFADTSSWLIAEWKKSGCHQATTEMREGARRPFSRWGLVVESGTFQGRDVRGRALRPGSTRYLFPWESAPVSRVPERP